MGQGKEAFSVHADPEPGGPQRTGDVPGNVACRVVHEHVCVSTSVCQPHMHLASSPTRNLSPPLPASRCTSRTLSCQPHMHLASSPTRKPPPSPPPRLPLPKQDIIVVGDGFRGCKAWAGAKHTPVLQVAFGVRSWRGFVARPTAQVHFVAAFGVPLTYPTHIRQALVVCPAPPPHPPPSRCPSLCPLRSPFSSSLRSTGELCTSTSFAQASAAPIATRSSGRCRTGVCLVCLAAL